MYLYPLGTHIIIMSYAKCTPFDPLFIGVISPEDLIFYWKFRNFYHLSRKDPLFCAKTKKTKRPHRKLPHFCHEKASIPFFFSWICHRKTPVRLFIQIVCPGISPSPLYSLPVNVCLSHWCLA